MNINIDELIKVIEDTSDENDRFLKHLINIRTIILERRTELIRIKRELELIKEKADKTPVESVISKKASQSFQAVGRILNDGKEEKT